MKHFFSYLVGLFITLGCYGQKQPFVSAKGYVQALKQATDVMVNDVTSPVAAARYYAYITLAANETVGQFNSEHGVLKNLLKNYTPYPINKTIVEHSDAGLATLLALYSTAIRLLPSGPGLQKSKDSLLQLAAAKGFSKQRIAASQQLADSITTNMLRYAREDGFAKLSGYKRFTPTTGDAYWQPTAPGFIAAIEPNWNTLRPFMLDSVAQFGCPPPHAYSTDTSSLFYKELQEVYVSSKNLSKDQLASALFWDCNPFALEQVGHLEFGIKKISPGGHWMGITGIACLQKKQDLFQTAAAHACVAVAMADAFIACWDDKYRYNRVRPVTAIQRLIDRNWTPVLQTPPFPEYTSGHSVLSAAAAAVLTNLFGDTTAFTDDTETEFGLPKKSFASFNAAAAEAALSRLYGGIHFRDAIENGFAKGKAIGNFVVQKMAAVK